MSRLRSLPVSFYRRPADEVARDLLGRWLVRDLDGERLVLRLVEVEAYLGAPDRASHAWGGRRTLRNASLYLPGGHAYVYFIYGMHWCLNAVTGERDIGSAVLIRAGEPLAGEERMLANRGLAPLSPGTRERGDGIKVRAGDLAGGPGKLCQALAIDRTLDGVRLDKGALRITAGEPVEQEEIAAGPRIGVDYAKEAAAWPLRFALRGNPHVSRPRPDPQRPWKGTSRPSPGT